MYYIWKVVGCSVLELRVCALVHVFLGVWRRGVVESEAEGWGGCGKG